MYVFSGKICKAYEKDVSGHEGILVKVAWNRLGPCFQTQLFSCWRGVAYVFFLLHTGWDAGAAKDREVTS